MSEASGGHPRTRLVVVTVLLVATAALGLAEFARRTVLDELNSTRRTLENASVSRARAATQLGQGIRVLSRIVEAQAADPAIRAVGPARDAAEGMLRAVRAYDKEARESSGDDTAVAADLARLQTATARLQLALGDRAGSTASLKEAIDLFRYAAEANGNTTGDLADLADTRTALAKNALLDGNAMQAEQTASQAVGTLTPLVDRAPIDTRIRRQLSEAHLVLANAQVALDRRADAERSFMEARFLTEEAITEDPGKPEDQRRLAEVYGTMGRFLLDSGRDREATNWIAATRDALRKLAGPAPASSPYGPALADSEEAAADFLVRTGDASKAPKALGRALALREKIAANTADPVGPALALALTRGRLGHVAALNGDKAAAESNAVAAFDLATAVAKQAPDRPEPAEALGELARLSALNLALSGKTEEPTKTIEAALARIQGIKDPAGADRRKALLARIRLDQARLERAAKHLPAAATAAREAAGVAQGRPAILLGSARELAACAAAFPENSPERAEALKDALRNLKAALDAGLGQRKPEELAADFPALKGSAEFDALAKSLAPKAAPPPRRR